MTMTAPQEKHAVINLVCNLLKLKHIRCTVFNNSNPVANGTQLQSRILFCRDDSEALGKALQQIGAIMLSSRENFGVLSSKISDYKFRNYTLYMQYANPTLVQKNDDFDYNRQIIFVED